MILPSPVRQMVAAPFIFLISHKATKDITDSLRVIEKATRYSSYILVGFKKYIIKKNSRPVVPHSPKRLALH